VSSDTGSTPPLSKSYMSSCGSLRWITLNRLTTSPILLAILSLMVFLPGAISVHAQPASVSVTPSVNAGDVGGQFTVSIVASDVGALVGYDVVVTYDPTVLSAVSSNFNAAPDVFAGMNAFSVNGYCSDAIGQCQSTQTLLGGSSVDLSASSAQLYSITFQVLTAASANINIASADIAALVSGSIQPVTVTTSNATFQVPPGVTMVSPYATVPKAAFHLKHQDTSVTISAMIIYSATNVRAGFGGVIFDVIDPHGGDMAIQSNLQFFLTPGTSGTVTATYLFANSGNALGTYHIIVTVLRCPDSNSCINGNTVSSPTFFFVKA